MLQRVIALSLAPLLLRQARTVRRTMPRLPEPAGTRAGTAGKGPTLRLLVAGDSAAAGVGVTRQDEALSGQLVSRLSKHCEVHWQLSARSGLTTSQIAERLAAEPARQSDVALISAGVNDVLSRLEPKKWPDLLAKLVDILRRHHKVQHIVFAPLPPMQHFSALPQPLRWLIGQRAKAFNRELVAFVQIHPDCAVLELLIDFDSTLMAADGFHPSAQTYALWAEAAAAEIQRVLDL